MKPADLTYITSGLFTRFMPLTKAGEDAWREMAKDDGVAAVLTYHAKSVIHQLRKAGYSVTKAKPAKVTAEEVNELLKELGA